MKQSGIRVNFSRVEAALALHGIIRQSRIVRQVEYFLEILAAGRQRLVADFQLSGNVGPGHS